MKTVTFIFDFDGTIADTFSEFVNIYNQLSDEFKINKIRPSDIKHLKNKTSYEIVKYLKIPLRKVPALLSKGKKLLYESTNKIMPHKGLKAMLEKLKQTGSTIGIVTSNSQENVTCFLETHHFNCFEFISASSKFWGKNKPLQALLANQDLQPEKVLYIGDETRDIEAAKKAGIQVVAVTWGYNSGKILKAHQPDYMIDQPEELLSIYQDFQDKK